jgi:LysM repeat protein
MSFARGRFGIEYNPEGRRDESHPFRWILPVFALIALISFICARGCRKTAGHEADVVFDVPVAPQPPDTPPPPDTPALPIAHKAPPGAQTPPPAQPALPTQQTAAQQTSQPQNAARAPAPAQTNAAPHVSSKAVKAAERWLETARTRSPDEATLLARLADAERLGNVRIVRDTLEKLRRRNAMADLDDPFARRLGTLNAEMLFTPNGKERDGWTVQVAVKRGDNAQRIAREHGTTLAAVLKLNSLKDANRIRTGDKLRVLEFPRAELVVHASLRYADLTLNRRFFKRYDVSLPKKPANGSYPVTRDEGPMFRFDSLGLKFTPADREELALLLAPGSRIIVAPM